MSSSNWPREYERVTPIEEVDQSDYVALSKARSQWVRDRAVSLEELKILRRRVMECQRREEVNHPQRCRDDAIAYFEAFKKYKSQGWKGINQ